MTVTITCSTCGHASTSVDMSLKDTNQPTRKETKYTNVYCVKCGKVHNVKVIIFAEQV